MKVASIITAKKSIVSLFEEFVLSYNKLQLKEKDGDTFYFSNYSNHKLEIYYHYILNNVQEEFSYNYNEGDRNKIKQAFKEDELFIFDISYRDEIFFKQLLKDFGHFLYQKNDIEHVLISHPNEGVKKLSDISKATY
jgi:hypothetical protein